MGGVSRSGPRRHRRAPVLTWTEERGRSTVIARAHDGRCELCGRPGESIQHRVKQGQGGTWAPSNLIRLCGDGTTRCHGWVEAHPRWAMVLGLWVRSTDDPARVPMFCHPVSFWRGWWWADDDGCWQWIDNDPRPDDAERIAAVEAVTRHRLAGIPAGASYRI